MTHPDLDEPNRTPHPKTEDTPNPDEPNRTRPRSTVQVILVGLPGMAL